MATFKIHEHIKPKFSAVTSVSQENYSKRVIAYDPGFSASYGTLATVSLERGQNKEAKEFLHKLISLEPNNQQALSILKGLNN